MADIIYADQQHVIRQVEEHFRRANEFHAAGAIKESIIELKEALRLMPDSPEAHFNFANVLRDGGQLDLAVEGFIVAINNARRMGRAYPDALINLGDVLSKQKKYDHAIEAFTDGIAADPMRAESHIGLGLVHYEKGDHREALRSFRRAAILKPGDPHVMNNIALAEYRLGDPEASLETYAEALEADPDYAEGHTHRGLMLMLLGRYEEGLAEYEWRWKTAFFKGMNVSFARPHWQGEDLTGKTVLVYTEQGYGDTLQFARYLPLLKERAARVILMTEPPLLRLMESLPGIEILPPEVAESAEKRPDHDYVISLMSLPHRFGTTLKTIPAAVPYLAPAPGLVELWRSRLQGIEGLRVGVCWAGRPEHKFDRDRSMVLADLAPLNAIPGVTLISLQQGPRAEEPGAALTRFGTFTDFAETAAVMENLDLVLAVDTAVCHLAGALGKPVWLMLHAVAEWRWGMSGETTPWYPTMRLWRQQEPGDWQALVARIAREIKRLSS
jgi:tetratricopeptide (TPR) repeat protein